ncbi:hypothetical protein CGCF415_v002387 [Colletotrichum fructicola]|uniref:Uncharacterized protein n=1 Tax=Colletotrichum fructicola (strain Nara gc5) TaxID=1213859 RepID=A0A7J6JHJ8_COLFN|nr:uncharacterized protein CGMCC3_g4733 [Colletotrichum fructicola]KAF4488714.1 hypothetical protein CGGC5_v002891 [Colletotrichum fructicola Nara gc5]KAE9579249.1 hypothetical protein CGMCC3_g4733 [Colletotrichum fructicola]KAF4429909.1 hypothetical protein CFRS1_v011819 [Colletotrichum fructicola]KAF4902594.1 hypothetical protein CGCFRS4_v002138 [Colletotrichum fructicola]KAF4914464.1 hypothetical protein CGCF415_v002387 [Colletotrichum fructicola]
MMVHQELYSPPNVHEKRTSTPHDSDDEDLDIDPFPQCADETSTSLLSHHDNPSPSKPRRQYTLSLPILILTITTSLLLGISSTLALQTLLSPSPSNPSTRNANTLASPSPSDLNTTYLLPFPCGATPSAARAAGCLFDLISFNWLPLACHDAALAATFEAELRAAGELAWYRDMNRTAPLTREQIMTGEYTGVYVSLAYHLRHCTAMWRRMHRALIQGGGGLGRVDSYIWGYHHTLHCEETLLGRRNEMEAEVFTTEVRIKYPDCGVVI